MPETLVGEEQIAEVVESVFTAMLSLPTILGQDPSAVHGSAQLVASVHIAGAWNGTVMLLCSEQFGRRAGSIMLGVGLSGVKLSDAHDAVAELANIIGGSLKSILPGPSTLSLPSVTYGAHYNVHFPHTTQAARIDFVCDDEPLQVRLLQAQPG